MYRISENLDSFLNHRANTQTLDDFAIKAFPTISVNQDFQFKFNDSLTQEFFSYRMPKSISPSQAIENKSQSPRPKEPNAPEKVNPKEKGVRAVGINISKKNRKLKSNKKSRQ